MWEFKKIGIGDKKLLDDFLKNEKIRLSFFSSSYSLNIFLNNGSKQLFLATEGSNNRLVLLREKTFGSDVRILISAPAGAVAKIPPALAGGASFSARNDNDLIAGIRERFNPAYIAYNLLADGSLPYPERSERRELIIDTLAVSGLQGRRLKHDYELFSKKHPDVGFEKIKQSQKDALLEFISQWDLRPVTKPRVKGAENDKLFVESYLGDSDIGGEVAVAGDKIIGFAAFVPDWSGKNAIGLFNKCLRGYTQLGVRLNVDWAIQMQERGLAKAAIGEFNAEDKNCFKLRFASGGEILKMYSYQIYKNDKIKLHGDYLGSIL